MKLNNLMKRIVCSTKTKAVAAGAGLTLFAGNAFAVLSTEAQALVTGVETEADVVTEVVWALGPVIIGIVGAIAVVIVALMIFKKGSGK